MAPERHRPLLLLATAVVTLAAPARVLNLYIAGPRSVGQPYG